MLVASQPAATPQGPVQLFYSKYSEYNHDSSAYTQGLYYAGNGTMLESTGLYGQSTLRKTPLLTGIPTKVKDLPSDRFGEGIAVRNGRVYTLTWKSQEVLVYDEETFELQEVLQNPSPVNEGWGLTHDGTDFILSDGSDQLHILDSKTFEIKRSVTVTVNGNPQNNLNELEYFRGLVYANVWLTAWIVVIDPLSGVVVAAMDVNELYQEVVNRGGSPDVVNGIAFNQNTGRMYVTGKLWGALFELQILNLPTSPSSPPFSPTGTNDNHGSNGSNGSSSLLASAAVEFNRATTASASQPQPQPQPQPQAQQQAQAQAQLPQQPQPQQQQQQQLVQSQPAQLSSQEEQYHLQVQHTRHCISLVQNCLSLASYQSHSGFLFHPLTSSSFPVCLHANITVTPSAADWLVSVLRQEVQLLAMSVTQRLWFQQEVGTQGELRVVQEDHIPPDQMLGLGAFRFTPNLPLSPEHLDSINSVLAQSLKTAGDPSLFEECNSAEGVCTVVTTGPAVVGREGIRTLVAHILLAASQLKMPDDAVEGMSEVVIQGIKEAEKRIETSQLQAITASSVLRKVPLVGWLLPAPVTPSVEGQTFSLAATSEERMRSSSSRRNI